MSKNLKPAPAPVTLYRVTTVTRRGALPHTVRVAATTRAAATVMAVSHHRVEQNLPRSASITVAACREVGATVL